MICYFVLYALLLSILCYATLYCMLCYFVLYDFLLCTVCFATLYLYCMLSYFVFIISHYVIEYYHVIIPMEELYIMYGIGFQ